MHTFGEQWWLFVGEIGGGPKFVQFSVSNVPQRKGSSATGYKDNNIRSPTGCRGPLGVLATDFCGNTSSCGGGELSSTRE